MVSKFVKLGAPVIILVVAGSFGLQQFTNIRFQFFEQRKFFKEIEKAGIKVTPREELTLEKQFEKMKEVDIDNWENIRGPRPWEEGNQLYLDAVERGKKIKEMREKQ